MAFGSHLGKEESAAGQPTAGESGKPALLKRMGSSFKGSLFGVAAPASQSLEDILREIKDDVFSDCDGLQAIEMAAFAQEASKVLNESLIPRLQALSDTSTVVHHKLHKREAELTAHVKKHRAHNHHNISKPGKQINFSLLTKEQYLFLQKEVAYWASTLWPSIDGYQPFAKTDREEYQKAVQRALDRFKLYLQTRGASVLSTSFGPTVMCQLLALSHLDSEVAGDREQLRITAHDDYQLDRQTDVTFKIPVSDLRFADTLFIRNRQRVLRELFSSFGEQMNAVYQRRYEALVGRYCACYDAIHQAVREGYLSCRPESYNAPDEITNLREYYHKVETTSEIGPVHVMQDIATLLLQLAKKGEHGFEFRELLLLNKHEIYNIVIAYYKQIGEVVSPNTDLGAGIIQTVYYHFHGLKFLMARRILGEAEQIDKTMTQYADSTARYIEEAFVACTEFCFPQACQTDTAEQKHEPDKQAEFSRTESLASVSADSLGGLPWTVSATPSYSDDDDDEDNSIGRMSLDGNGK